MRFLAALGSLGWLALGLQWLLGIRGVPVLDDLHGTRRPGRYPSLSVILAARNEERSVREGVESVLNQRYPGRLEVVAVDDRSADRTGDILDELATRYPGKLRVLKVEILPAGWLGKCHALYLGATQASGEWLLFTDADVRLSPTCSERAVRHAVEENLDHLTLTPEILSRHVLLRAFVSAFALIFEVTQRPWRASDPRAREHVGIGAFNLIRAEAYGEIGTYRAIRMRPDDDMKLAKLVKDHGLLQGVAYGTGLVAVEWHQTLGGAVRGLSKSMFPALDYRIGATVAGVLALSLTNLLPILGLLSHGVVRMLCGTSVLSTFFLYAFRSKHSKAEPPWWYAALHPIGVCVFVYAMLRSAGTTIANRGIEWRGTRYPLEALKENPL